MADISKITTLDGSTYNIKDEEARQDLAGVDITSAFTSVASIVNEFKVYKIGDLIVAYFVADRSITSANVFEIATIPASYRPSSYRWTGAAMTNSNGVGTVGITTDFKIRVFFTNGSKISWAQGTLFWMIGK